MFRFAFLLAAGLAASVAAHANANVDAGIWAFVKDCNTCHSLQPDENGLGPTADRGADLLAFLSAF